MLLELRIENLLLIEAATLRFGPGLNAITGETGAGKTILADAVGLLLGGKPRSGMVRPGAGEAYVEGVFEAPKELLEDPGLAHLKELEPEGSDELVVGRRVSAEGRTRAYFHGRSVPAADLAELGARLLMLSGQHEHRKLVSPAAQLETLDAFCGAAHLQVLSEHEAAFARQRELLKEIRELGELAERRDRDLELLEHELAEIDRVELTAERERQLEDQASRLQHAEALRLAALAGAEALRPETDGDGSLIDRLATAESALAQVADLDAELDGLAERFRGFTYEAEELARDLRAYESGIGGDPALLGELEEERQLFADLKLKHGGTVEAVVEYAQRARGDRDRLAVATSELERVEAELKAISAKVEQLAATLSAKRKRTAPRLTRAIEAELTKLGMQRAAFSVEFATGAQHGPAGADRIDFFIAVNPGVPAGPIREIASGGELSRVQLAILSVAQAESDTATIFFDEIDSGIGGATARVVGEKLRVLGNAKQGTRQIVCITHLPQIASLADYHFRIVKEIGTAAGAEVTNAHIERIDSGQVVAELCRMLGADLEDAGARRHAEELLRAA